MGRYDRLDRVAIVCGNEDAFGARLTVRKPVDRRTDMGLADEHQQGKQPC